MGAGFLIRFWVLGSKHLNNSTQLYLNSMKNLTHVFLAQFLVTSLTSQTSIMTYNIRYANAGDKENSWDNRKEEVVDLLQYYQPNIFGVQEGLIGQVVFIDQHLVNHVYTGVGRDDGKQGGEFTAIFYDTTQVDLLDSKTYWLSETPEVPSVGWDASFRRIVTIGTFFRKSQDDTLIVFNCHFDNNGRIARNNSANQIVQYIINNKLTDNKIAVIGDFNCSGDEEPVRILKSLLQDASITGVTHPYGPVGTFNGFDTDKVPDWKIDYVFVRNTEVLSHRVIDDRRKNNLWPSDHLPVLVEIR